MISSRQQKTDSDTSKSDKRQRPESHALTSTAQANPLWQSMTTNVAAPAVQRLCAECEDELSTGVETVQPQLSVGGIDDPYEREADAVADQVMRKSSAVGVRPQATPTPVLQTKAYSATQANGASAAVSQTLASPGSGSALAPAMRAQIEPVLGADLSQVRVHSGASANSASQSLNARAFTHRSNIFLGPGESSSDLGLMAHEATHTLQQGAVLRRWPAVTPSPAETAHAPATIRALSLSDFISLTERQLDWATSPALQADTAALTEFRAIQTFAGGTGVTEACGGLNMGDIGSKGVPAVFAPLHTYTRGVTSGSTAWLRRTTNINDAESWGRDLTGLEAIWPAANLSLVMAAPSPRSNPSPFEKLATPATPELGNFMTYLSTCSPVLSAGDGSEVDSFLDLRGEGALPHSYNASISYVTTYHHFTKNTLDGLVANEAFPQWRQDWAWTQRPLTVVLYPTVDNNGAFHRNVGLENLVTNTNVLTIVIEGHATVLDYQTQLAPVAARYGIGGEIQQAMVGGHGNSTVLELAGTAGASINSDSLGTSGAEGTNTTNLMAELTRLMSSDPARRRILLDACLTDSQHVQSALRATPADAAADVQAAVVANPSLRDFVETLAGAGSTVLGANASFAPAQTTFIDPVSGELTLQVPGDPALVASKLEYVEFGTEPEGCMRAVLECWADDQITGSTDCRDAMQRRIAAGRSTRVPTTDTWREGIIQPVYNLVVNSYWGNGEMIRLLGELAGELFLLYWDGHTSASDLDVGLSHLGNVAHINQVLTPLSGHSRYSSVPRVAVVIEQAWMLYNPARRSNFMTALARYASCLEASSHVEMWMIMTEVPHMLTLPPPASPAVAELRLALMATNDTPLPNPAPAVLPAHIDFLRQLLGAAAEFPAALGIDAALGGLATEGEILAAIGRPRSGPSIPVDGAAPPPRANIDLDRDATNMNEFHVTPRRANGEVTASRLRVRSRPTTSTSSIIFDHVVRGDRVIIIGEYRRWFAIEHGSRTGFVWSGYINILP